MFNFKFFCQWGKDKKMSFEYGTNNSSDLSVKKKSFTDRMIDFSLEFATLVGIWKYLICPLFL